MMRAMASYSPLVSKETASMQNLLQWLRASAQVKVVFPLPRLPLFSSQEKKYLLPEFW